MRSVLVVGASLAGITAARTLRAEGFDGTVTLVDAETEPGYDRPPLSKGYLEGTASRSDIGLLSASDAHLELDWRCGARAVRLDLTELSVELDDGSRVAADGIVLATGAAPAMPRAWSASGAHVLRSADDADALRAALVPGSSLVVIGSGFIGAEVATVARAMGCDVTVVGRESAPLERAIGARLGAALVGRFSESGVRLICERAVTALAPLGNGAARVELDDGEVLVGDAVLVAVGALPAVSWLEGSGLDLTDGVQCSHAGSAGPEGVVAVGDCAAWAVGARGPARRHEHWTAAMRRGEIGARRLLHGPALEAELDPEPPAYVWSDQMGARLQMAGELTGEGDVWLLGVDGPLAPLGASDLPGEFIVGLLCADVLTGVLAGDAPRAFARWRRRIGQSIAAGAIS